MNTSAFIVKTVLFSVCVSLAIAAHAQRSLSSNPADYANVNYVLEIMADSRLVRELKSAPEQVRAAFSDTLRGQVYQHVDQSVLNSLQELPGYAGKNMVIHEFRTPGSDPATINADRDARVLMEADPGNWVEVPRQHWEDRFYEAFGEASGKPEGVSSREHASRYRQLATDRTHVEAGLDYTDQQIGIRELDGQRRVVATSTIRQARNDAGELIWNSDGTPAFISDSNIQAVKAGTPDNRAVLRDSEGLGYMYYEKGDEQLRRTLNAEMDVDSRSMHRAEAAVQIGKGVRSLESLRNSYALQGYDIGQLPENFRRAAAVVSAQTGDLSADPDGLDRQLQALGFENGLASFNDRMRGQMEALKIAPRKPPIAPPVSQSAAPGIATMLNRNNLISAAGSGAGLGGTVLDVVDFIDSVERIEQEINSGQHLYIDLDQDDDRFVRNAAIYGFALLETTGIPGALEMGWQADSAEQARIEAAIRRGETISPLLSTARVMTDVASKAVKSVIYDPVAAGIDRAGDIAAWSEAVLAESAALETADRQQEAVTEARIARLERESEFDLGLIRKWRNAVGDERLTGPVMDGDLVIFEVDRSETWTSDFEVIWELSGFGSLQQQNADASGAHQMALPIRDWPTGTYTVTLNVRGRADGRIYGQEIETFELNPDAGLGTLTARLDTLDGPLLQGAVEHGRAIAFDVAPLGVWDDSMTVEWLVNGELYKSTPGNGERAELIRFTTDNLPPAQAFQLAVRLIDNDSGRVLAHKDQMVSFIQEIDQSASLQLRASRDDVDGPSLEGAVRNGDILAFSVELEFADAVIPMVTNLSWQVIDEQGQPVAGLNKLEQVLEAGVQKQFAFRFRPEQLPNGRYQVLFMRQQPGASDLDQQASLAFEVMDSVRIERVVSSTDGEALDERTVLEPEDAPHLFVYYHLNGVQQADVSLRVVDQQGGLLFSQDVQRELRPGDVQRVGLRLEPGVVSPGTGATFEVTVRAADGMVASASHFFEVRRPEPEAQAVPEEIFSAVGSVGRSYSTPQVCEGDSAIDSAFGIEGYYWGWKLWRTAEDWKYLSLFDTPSCVISSGILSEFGMASEPEPRAYFADYPVSLCGRQLYAVAAEWEVLRDNFRDDILRRSSPLPPRWLNHPSRIGLDGRWAEVLGFVPADQQPYYYMWLGNDGPLSVGYVNGDSNDHIRIHQNNVDSSFCFPSDFPDL